MGVRTDAGVIDAAALIGDGGSSARAGPDLFIAYRGCGPKQPFWGSDVSRLRHPYRQMVTLFTDELPWLGGEDKARGWLGWEVGGAG